VWAFAERRIDDRLGLLAREASATAAASTQSRNALNSRSGNETGGEGAVRVCGGADSAMVGWPQPQIEVTWATILSACSLSWMVSLVNQPAIHAVKCANDRNVAVRA
jgi:hypothetical protein